MTPRAMCKDVRQSSTSVKALSSSEQHFASDINKMDFLSTKEDEITMVHNMYHIMQVVLRLASLFS